MSDQTPDDPPPWVMGPPEGYDPPPIETLTDPEVPARIAEVGRELVLAVLASKGHHKTERGWTRETPTQGDTP